jgi:hypothetical protein
MSRLIQVPFGSRGQTVTRIAPLMGAEHYKTYGMARPLKTHWRPATCEEAGCLPYRKGWVTTVDLTTDLGQRQYHFITHDRERRYSVQRVTATLLKFTYGPGFPCFRRSEHRLPVERPARFYVAEGDFRGNPRRVPVRVHTRAEDWVEDFSGHQDKLVTALGRG